MDRNGRRGNAVLGFYTLGAMAVRVEFGPKKWQRARVPDVPVIYIRAVAVREDMQGKRIGTALVIDAMERCLEIADQMGAAAIVLDVLAWPFYEPEDLCYLNKVLNEQDFPPLMVLHDVLLSAKLVRHAKGAMHCTKLGKQLKSKPGELWTVLADHLLALDHAPYTRHEDSLVGNWEIFLNVINVEAQNGASRDRLSSALFGSGSEDGHHDHRLTAAFYIHVLRPLTWLGLLQEHRVGRGRERQDIFTKTPLWAAALALETDRHLENPTRH